jgi:transcriptional regulator with XRE-family HTH domain
MLGEKILKLRRDKGMSQEELASQITVSRQAISKWELGESVPDTEKIIQLCKIFSVSADFLLNDEIESDMDIPAVRENSDRLKKKYNRLLLWIISIGSIALIYLVLRELISYEISSAILIAGIAVVFTGVVCLVSLAVRTHRGRANK